MTARRILIRRTIVRRSLRVLVAIATGAVVLVCIPILIVKTIADAKAGR